MTHHKHQVIRTNPAQCRDCAKCLRVCPVKAIRMTQAQACVEGDLCLACGACIRECPQNAKVFREDWNEVLHLLSENEEEYVVAMLAPSWVSEFSSWEQERLPSALRALGFSFIGEVSVGVALGIPKMIDLLKERNIWISSACPASVKYLEMVHPQIEEYIMPIASPMVHYAHYLKEKMGENIKTVFIGPCLAKKKESDENEHVDYALTFLELQHLLLQKGVSLEGCEASLLDEVGPSHTKLFPMVGGLHASLKEALGEQKCKIITVTGQKEMDDMVKHFEEIDEPTFFELYFCPQGCLGGPGYREPGAYFVRKEHLERSLKKEQRGKVFEEHKRFDSQVEYDWKTPLPHNLFRHHFTETEIMDILVKTGKEKDEDQLNCGACGYESCREKAIAVLNGIAVPELCIPHMRKLAERRTDRIIETSPNGIITLNEQLEIVSMNPAFKKMFYCSDMLIGKRVSILFDPSQFEKISSRKSDSLDFELQVHSYGLLCRVFAYLLENENQIVGIFVNLTPFIKNKQQLDNMKSQTVKQASELLDKQIQMAQTVAKLLGEHTAQVEAMIQQILPQDIEEPKTLVQEDWNKKHHLSVSKILGKRKDS